MNKENLEEKDFPGEYINKGSRAMAPSGFTERVMNQIKAEPAIYPVKGIFRKSFTIPLVSMLVTLLLILASVILLPQSETTLIPGIFAAIKNIELSLPQINTDWFNTISLPAIVMYIMAGFVLLSLLDRFLNRLFHR